MGNVIYKPLIEDMTWSYSRVTCFENCPYQWYLKYIYECDSKPQFYSSYGSFMHKLIEGYYKGELSKEEMLTKFLFDFQECVEGDRPSNSISEKYINLGIAYLKSFTPFPFNTIAVEKQIEFDINGNHFVGFLDYIGEKDGCLYIIDNKSRDLSPRSKRKNPTLKDQELDAMLRQLYLYAAAVKQEYGKYPDALCFNCFKNGNFIEEKFNHERFVDACDWVTKEIEYIKNEEDFRPRPDFFQCKYLCDVSDECCYAERR